MPGSALASPRRFALRIDELADALADSVFKTAHERVATTILRIGGPECSPGAELKITHEQLAGMAAVSRETTTKILGEFSDEGLVTLRRGRITVLDQGRLASAAGG